MRSSLSTKCEGVSLVLRAVVTLACGGSGGAQQQWWWWCTVVGSDERRPGGLQSNPLSSLLTSRETSDQQRDLDSNHLGLLRPLDHQRLHPR